MNFKNKRILITAGPTWVPIDSVRVISNIATGETGALLANRLAGLRARVTLFLGPVKPSYIDRRVKVIDFKFFDELRSRLKKELRFKKYDIVIHNAAVSDFKPLGKAGGKISSKRNRTLSLSPLPKIFEDIRRLNPKADLVIFKLEAGVSDRILIKRGKSMKNKAGADLVIANRLSPYRAFIIGAKDEVIPAKNKRELIIRLTKLLVTGY